MNAVFAILLLLVGCAELPENRYFVSDLSDIGPHTAKARSVFHASDSPALIVDGPRYFGSAVFIEVSRNGRSISVSPEMMVTKDGRWIALGKPGPGEYRATLFVDGRESGAVSFSIIP